jgi:hypothetical protein
MMPPFRQAADTRASKSKAEARSLETALKLVKMIM